MLIFIREGDEWCLERWRCFPTSTSHHASWGRLGNSLSLTTGVVRSTDLILADNQSCVAISLRPGQVQLGWPLPSSPLWNEPIPKLSPHTHILNQVVDITLSWAPHHSFVFSSSRWQQLAEVTNDVTVRIPLSSDKMVLERYKDYYKILLTRHPFDK